MLENFVEQDDGNEDMCDMSMNKTILIIPILIIGLAEFKV